jgi:hypothetical protein
MSFAFELELVFRNSAKLGYACAREQTMECQYQFSVEAISPRTSLDRALDLAFAFSRL